MLRKKRTTFFILLISCFIPFVPVVQVHCESAASAKDSDNVTPEPYTDDEFPQWSKDLRRAEIVSLGAIPFAAISVTMAYGGYQYASGKSNSFPNPLSRDNSYTKEEIFKLVGVSAGVGLSVGLVDFVINYTRRKKAEKERLLEEAKQNENIRAITPEEAGDLLRKNSKNIEEDSKSEDTTEQPASDEDSDSEK